MIGSALKKMAKENAMKTDRGVAYGNLRGYAATLSEGAGWKQIVFATAFADPVKKTEFMDSVGAVDVAKQYRVQKLGVTAKAIQVTFLDNPGTMKKIYAFLDWFVPMLDSFGANKVNICAECGFEVTAGKWVLINGVAYYLHDNCAEHVRQEIEASNTEEKETATGSYVSGALGAFIGAAVGAVVWALVLLLGYVASLVGFVIGWLAEKGYTLLKGKNGKAKILILILAIIFGVVAGTFAADAISLANMINSGELPGWGIGDIPEMLMILMEDSEYVGATVQNILLGLLFAALGVFALLRQTKREVSGVSFAELK